VNSDEARARIAAAEPDVVVVCAFGALIKEPLLGDYEIFNVHPSLLPRWRGAAPIERAIMAGDGETGVGIMRLEAGLDTGPVCLAGREPIAPDDTFGTLSDRLSVLAGDLLVDALTRRPPFIAQAEDGVTYAAKIEPEDRVLDGAARGAAELERVVRALEPHIGARVALPDGTGLGVHRAAVASDASGPEPGRLAARDGRLLLGCAPGTLDLLTVQPAGGRAMAAADYLRGRPV